MKPPLFTPLNETKSKRLTFAREDVKTVEGDPDRRVLGKKGVVMIDGTLYHVIGLSCGLPGCNCDAMIKEVKE